MKVEVLVAAMNQADFSLYEKMHICTDMIIANQSGRNGFEEKYIQGNCVKMLSSKTRGVGKNRNIALTLASADILLFSDMDVVYYNNYDRIILDSFKANPTADAFIFGMDYTKNGKTVPGPVFKNRRLHFFNAMRYGAVNLAIRKKSIDKYNIRFSELFGGGSTFGSGEDSAFILDLLKAGGRLYSTDKTIGCCSTDESSWFVGFDEKYMYDKGALVANCFPRTKEIVKYYYPLRFRKLSRMSFREILFEINEGIEGYKTLTPYNKFKSRAKNN